MLLPQAREERAGRLGVRERFNKVLDVFYHVVVADEEGATLMQAFRDNIQNTLFTVAGLTARLFGEEGHRVAFIQQAQLAFRVAGWRCSDRDRCRLSAGCGGSPPPASRYSVRYKDAESLCPLPDST